ncbi:MAG: AMP-binding protein, partial [Chloroflexia bacterium]
MLRKDTTLTQAFREVAEAHPRRLALKCESTQRTYGQLLEEMERLAGGLRRLGLVRGERVALLLPPGEAFAVSFFAVAGVGGVVVPLNPQTRPQGIAQVLRDAEAAVVISGHPLAQEIRAEVPALRLAVVLEGEGDLHFEDLLASPRVHLPDPAVAPDDLAALLYTSGTTGSPKGTMHSHRSLIAPVAASVQLRELWLRRFTPSKVLETAWAVARYGGRLLRAAGRPQTFLSTMGW